MQYINVLIDEYGLRTLPKTKPVIGLDDLYLLLYTHWVLDDATYSDERQRVEVATGILMAVFFGCRPCSLFDTRVKFDPNGSDEPPNNMAGDHAFNSGQGSDEVESDGGNDVKRSHEGDTVMAVDSGCEVDEDSHLAFDSDGSSDNDSSSVFDCDEDCDTDGSSVSDCDGDCDTDGSSNGDSSSIYDCDEDCDTDDDCNTGPEETRSFLYRHYTISIIANPTPGKPNLVFMKATLLHTKGEDNHPRT